MLFTVAIVALAGWLVASFAHVLGVFQVGQARHVLLFLGLLLLLLAFLKGRDAALRREHPPSEGR